MERSRRLRQSGGKYWQQLVTAWLVVAALVLAGPGVVPARAVEIGGKPVKLGGYINQGIGYGIGGNAYDSMQGFQSFTYDVLLEAEYEPNRDLSFFLSTMLSGDFAYDILNDSKDWKNKGFNRSRRKPGP